jgi:hypothetical protein
MAGFADHKSAPIAASRAEGLSRATTRRSAGRRGNLKLMLDDDSKSGIEYQASLIESLFANAANDRSTK